MKLIKNYRYKKRHRKKMTLIKNDTYKNDIIKHDIIKNDIIKNDTDSLAGPLDSPVILALGKG